MADQRCIIELVFTLLWLVCKVITLEPEIIENQHFAELF